MGIFKFKPKKIGDFTVKSVDYHRNGICGEGFMTGIFTCNKAKYEEELGDFVFTMFASWSGEGKDETFGNASGDYKCAILKVDDINKGDLDMFTGGAWRGDVYYSNIVQGAIREYERQRDKHYKIHSTGSNK